MEALPAVSGAVLPLHLGQLLNIALKQIALYYLYQNRRHLNCYNHADTIPEAYSWNI